MGVATDFFEDPRARWSVGLGGLLVAVGFGSMAFGLSLVARIAFGLFAAAVVAGLVMYFGLRLVQLLQARRQSRFEAELVAREGVAERRSEWKNWSQELDREGIDRYSLPFFLLVGEPQSGKSVLLQNSGLNFPFGQAKLSGVAGTRGCDWWFTQEAVILDIAGRMFTHESSPSDAAEWQAFLELLAAYRPLAPADGVLLVLPCDGLSTDGEDAIRAKADRIRASLSTLVDTLDVSLPIYVVLTKGDRVFGFAETVHRLETRQREQMFGWSRGATTYARPYAEDEVRAGFRELVRRSRSLRAHAMATATLPEAVGEVDRLYAFPDELAGLEGALMTYLDGIFGAAPLDRRLFLRGLYLTSGLQTGVPIARLCHDAFRDVGEGDLMKLEAIFEKQRAYFIKDLIRKRVFSERGLVEPSEARTVKAKRARVGGFAASAAAVIAAVWLASSYFLQDRDEESDADRIAAITGAVDTADLGTLLAQSRELRDLAGTYAADTAADLTLGAEADERSAAAFDQHFDRMVVPAVARAVALGVEREASTLRIAGEFTFERLERATLAALSLEAQLDPLDGELRRGAAADRALPAGHVLLDAALAVGLAPTDEATLRALLEVRGERRGSSEPTLAADIGENAARALVDRWRELHREPERLASTGAHWDTFADVLELADRAQALEELAAAAEATDREPVRRFADAYDAAADVPAELAQDGADLRGAFELVAADVAPLRALIELRRLRAGDRAPLDPFATLDGDRIFAVAGAEAGGAVALAPRLRGSNDETLRELCRRLLAESPESEVAIASELEACANLALELAATRPGGLRSRAAGRAALGLGVAAWYEQWESQRGGPRDDLIDRVAEMQSGALAFDIGAPLSLLVALRGLVQSPHRLDRAELNAWIDDLDDLTAPARRALEADLMERIELRGLAAMDGEADIKLLRTASVEGESYALEFVKRQIDTEEAHLDGELTPNLGRHASLALALRSISSACALEALEGTLVATDPNVSDRIDAFIERTRDRVRTIVDELDDRARDSQSALLAAEDVFYLDKLAVFRDAQYREPLKRAARELRSAWIDVATAEWKARSRWSPTLLVGAVRELDQFESALAAIAGELPDRAAELEGFRLWYEGARDQIVDDPTGVTALLDAVGRPTPATVVPAGAGDRGIGAEVRAELVAVERSRTRPFHLRAADLRESHARLVAVTRAEPDAAFTPGTRLELDLPLLAAASLRRELADLALERWRALAQSDEGRRVLRYLVEDPPASVPTKATLHRFLEQPRDSNASDVQDVRLRALLGRLGLRVIDDRLSLVVELDGEIEADRLPRPAEDLDEWTALVDVADLVQQLTDGTRALIATVGMPVGTDGSSPGWNLQYFRIENGSAVTDVTVFRDELRWPPGQGAYGVKIDPTGALEADGRPSVDGELRLGWQQVARRLDVENGDIVLESRGALAPLLLCWNHSGRNPASVPTEIWKLRTPAANGEDVELRIEFNRAVPMRPRIPPSLLGR